MRILRLQSAIESQMGRSGFPVKDSSASHTREAYPFFDRVDISDRGVVFRELDNVISSGRLFEDGNNEFIAMHILTLREIFRAQLAGLVSYASGRNEEDFLDRLERYQEEIAQLGSSKGFSNRDKAISLTLVTHLLTMGITSTECMGNLNGALSGRDYEGALGHANELLGFWYLARHELNLNASSPRNSFLTNVRFRRLVRMKNGKRITKLLEGNGEVDAVMRNRLISITMKNSNKRTWSTMLQDLFMTIQDSHHSLVLNSTTRNERKRLMKSVQELTLIRAVSDRDKTMPGYVNQESERSVRNAARDILFGKYGIPEEHYGDYFDWLNIRFVHIPKPDDHSHVGSWVGQLYA